MLQSRTTGKKQPAARSIRSARGVKHSLSSMDERHRMISEAAYLLAERNGFQGDAEHYWLQAESEIDRMTSSAENRSEYLQKLEGWHHEWDDKYLRLKEKAKKAGAGLHSDLEKQFAALGDKRASAHGRIEELRARSDDAWDDLKGTVEKEWGEMKEALERIASRFK